MEITLNIPEELAVRLRHLEDRLPQILELGLREFNAGAQAGFEGMAEVVDQAEFHDPTVPVIANCTGQPLTSGKAIKAELLEQLCTPVQWRRSVVYLREAGVERFYEIGPGRVLAGLIRKTYPEAEVIGINDLDGARALAG